MLAGAGFGDDGACPCARHHDLAEHIVDLVRAGVVELLALEIDFGAAEMFGQALGEIERRRPADKSFEIAVSFRPGTPVGLGVGVGLLQIEDQRISVSATKRPPNCRNGRARRDRCGGIGQGSDSSSDQLFGARAARIKSRIISGSLTPGARPRPRNIHAPARLTRTPPRHSRMKAAGDHERPF